MKRKVLFFLTANLLLAAAVFAQGGEITRKDLPPAEIARIISKFTKNEDLFRRALNVYAFDRSAKMAEIGMGGQISGVYRRDSFMTFNEAGDRLEKITFMPMPTLTNLQVTVADIDNLGGIDPFAIEPKVADQYSFSYLGTEHVEPFDCYVFDVGPKVMPDPKKGIAKFFQGRVWVSIDDLMIVRSKGKAVPEGKERFPVVDTLRSSVDNKYYFPVYSSSDDTLVFENGQVIRIKFRVSYENYRLGRTDVRILDIDEPVPNPSPTPTSAPKKP